MRNIFQTKDKMAANESVEAVPSLESLISRARDLFRDKFGREAQVGGAAPGRVNLIGKEMLHEMSIVIFSSQGSTRTTTWGLCSRWRCPWSQWCWALRARTRGLASAGCTAAVR